jgi:hypothetical protein
MNTIVEAINLFTDNSHGGSGNDVRGGGVFVPCYCRSRADLP